MRLEKKNEKKNKEKKTRKKLETRARRSALKGGTEAAALAPHGIPRVWRLARAIEPIRAHE